MFYSRILDNETTDFNFSVLPVLEEIPEDQDPDFLTCKLYLFKQLSSNHGKSSIHYK